MTCRLFYPDSDPLTIYCPDNVTYWFVLYVSSQKIYQFKEVYYGAVVVEATALIFGYAFHLRAFCRFWRLRAIHLNFLLITLLLYIIMIAGGIGRILMLPYEASLIVSTDCVDTVLLVVALVRQISLVHPFFIFYGWTIERVFATVFVKDYEKKWRLHISVILISTILIFDFVTAYLIVTGVLSCFMFTVCAFVPIVMCTCIFYLLINCNKRWLARLTHRIRRYSDEYSLSLRVQLKENIWSLEKIQFGIYIIAGGIAVLGCMIFVPIMNLQSPDQAETLQWFLCAANLGFAVFIVCAAPWLEVAIAVHAGKTSPILTAFLCRKECQKQSRVSQSENRNETDEYFNQLDSQWNLGLNARNQRSAD